MNYALSYVTSPDQTATLEDFVAAGVNDDMTYINFSILNKINGMKVLDHNVIDDYIKELKGLSSEIIGLTNADRIRYRYSPDLLAYDMYHSTQLDFVILAVNGVVTPLEFTMMGKLYLPKASVLKSFLSMVYNAEQEYLSANKSDVEK